MIGFDQVTQISINVRRLVHVFYNREPRKPEKLIIKKSKMKDNLIGTKGNCTRDGGI